MEKIINKYKDENGLIRNLFDLYRELTNVLSKTEALKQIKKLSEENIIILRRTKRENIEMEKIILSRNLEVENIEYIQQEEITKPPKTIEQKINIEIDKDIEFYISYIEENLMDNAYLEILPKNNDRESIEILIKLLNYFKSKISLSEYFLSLETNLTEIAFLENELAKYYPIYKTIKEYKESLKNITEIEKKEFKNKVSYFMYGDIPYIYKDIEDNPESFETVLKLIESIEDGTFKNIDSFTNKLKGLLEVKNLSKQVRVIFELDQGFYCIIGAILSKSETNSIHQEKLRNRYNIYKQNKENSKYEQELTLRKLLKGDQNG